MRHVAGLHDEDNNRLVTFFLDGYGQPEYNSTYIELFSREMPMFDALSPPVNLQTLAGRLKVLAEPKRLLIINLLMDGVQCNCELGDALQMTPNLISHHLSKLREVGLVNVERDALDSRWVYYSVNRAALDELNAAFGAFFDPARIQPRRLTCGPSVAVCLPDGATSQPQTLLSEKKQS